MYGLGGSDRCLIVPVFDVCNPRLSTVFEADVKLVLRVKFGELCLKVLSNERGDLVWRLRRGQSAGSKCVILAHIDDKKPRTEC